MPVYTCTTAQSTLSAEIKANLAGEVTRIHSMINHVPGTYVNVVFHELAADDVYTDGRPAQPLLINGWVRTGHPEAQSSQLVAEIAAAATRVTGIPAKRVSGRDPEQPSTFRHRRWPGATRPRRGRGMAERKEKE